MRFAIILLVLLFAVAGAVFGALNSERVAFDFYFCTIQAPKGATLLAVLMLGWFIGGLIVYLALVLRLRRRVRTLARELSRREAADSSAPSRDA